MASTAGPKAAQHLDGSAFATSAAGAAQPPPKVSPIPVPKPGEVESRPPGTIPAKPTPVPAGVATDSQGTLVPRPPRDDVLPAIHDGRVRSPMPGKLKGTLETNSSMFGVMLMTGPTTGDINKRDAEAKRASESTQKAAEKALAEGQGAVRRTKFVQLPPEPAAASPFFVAPPPPPPTVPPAGQFGLSDAQIKAEQARLLTLLRSLNPLRVVDQICTALAFFGGIPGAPPPPNGAFPPSAMANGPGRLFVSWVAEIFPHVPNFAPGMPPPPVPYQVPQNPEATLEPPEPGVRKRGRPKGSKSTRPRKDKGIKKGPMWAWPDPVPKQKSGRPVGRPRKERPSEPGNAVDSSWVDVEPSEEEEEQGSESPEPDEAAAPSSVRAASQELSAPVRTALPAGSQEAESNPTPKRRGRPKGSKTRAKVPASTGNTGSEGSQPPQNSQIQPRPPVPLFEPMPQPASSPAITQAAADSASFTPVNFSAGAQTAGQSAAQPGGLGAVEMKKKGARQKGSKKKAISDQNASMSGLDPASTVDGTTAAAGSDQQSAPYGQYTKPSHAFHGQSSGAFASSQAQQNQSQAYEYASANQPSQQGLTLPQSPAQVAATNPMQHTPAIGQKRKRKSNKNAGQGGGSSSNSNNQAIAQQALETTGLTLPNDSSSSHALQGQSAQLPAETSGTSFAPPPAKRPRKGKDAKPNANIDAKSDTHSTVTDNSAGSNAATDPYGGGYRAPTEQPSQDPLILDVHPISSLQSPHSSHFGLHSPSMENYQAQLQAQLEHESELSTTSSAFQQTGTQNHPDPRQLMAIPLQHQQQYQLQYQQRIQQQRQHQNQKQQQTVQQGLQSTVGQAGSPMLPQHGVKPQPESRSSSQPIARTSQNSFSQHRPTTAQYGKQQSYSPQQFSVQRNPQANTQTPQGQQYPTGAQQQQYNTTQQQYTNSQSQYPASGQQQASGQSRYPQQQLVSAATTSSYPATQSPQFTSTNTGFASNDGTYRSPAPGMNLNQPYNSLQRSLTNSPASNGYRRGSTQQNRSPSTFDTTSSSQSQQQQQRSTPSSTGSMQPPSLQNTAPQSFASANNSAVDWNPYDASNAAQNQGHDMASYDLDGSTGGSPPFGAETNRFYPVAKR